MSEQQGPKGGKKKREKKFPDKKLGRPPNSERHPSQLNQDAGPSTVDQVQLSRFLEQAYRWSHNGGGATVVNPFNGLGSGSAMLPHQPPGESFTVSRPRHLPNHGTTSRPSIPSRPAVREPNHFATRSERVPSLTPCYTADEWLVKYDDGALDIMSASGQFRKFVVHIMEHGDPRYNKPIIPRSALVRLGIRSYPFAYDADFWYASLVASIDGGASFPLNCYTLPTRGDEHDIGDDVIYLSRKDFAILQERAATYRASAATS